jgi:predicted esterase
MGARLEARHYEQDGGYVLIGHSQGGAAVAQVGITSYGNSNMCIA